MQPFVGMNVEEVRSLASQLTTAAAQVRQVAGSLLTQVQAVNWIGADRERFVADWQGQMPQLYSIADIMESFSNRALQNAAEQDTAQQNG